MEGISKRLDTLEQAITDVRQWQQNGQNRLMLRTIRQKLTRHFSIEEMENLVFEMGDSAEDVLTEETKAGNARALVEFYDRRQQIAELLAVCCQQRPRVQWPSCPGDD